MTIPALAQDVKGKGRHYTAPDGRLLPSVTNILKALDKSQPLMYWASEVVVRAIAADPEAFGNDCARDLEAAIKTWRKVWTQQRDDAADRGTTIHEWLQAAIDGDPTDPLEALMDPETRMYLDGCEQFLAEEEPTGACEVTRIGPNYGGTADLLGKLNTTGDRLVVADWKTRSNGKHDVYEAEVLQLAALRYADIAAVLGEDGPVFTPSFAAEGALLVTFTPSGRNRYRVHDLSDRADLTAWGAFDSLRVVRQWMLAGKGNGRG